MYHNKETRYVAMISVAMATALVILLEILLAVRVSFARVMAVYVSVGQDFVWKAHLPHERSSSYAIAQ